MRYQERFTFFSLSLQSFELMDAMEPDWEGFQSFNEQPTLPLSPPPPKHPLHQPCSPERAEEKMSALQKKLTFRSKNKRKGSLVASLPSQPCRKNSTHLQTTLPQKTSLIDRLKRTSFLFEKKEDGIPIFHEAELRHPQGQLIYRRQRLSTAEEELARNGRHQSAAVGEELRFESRFESGNLEQVVRVGSEYHLFMAVDTNTRGHRQWFYFTVTAPLARKAAFVVHSFRKRLSLFQAGMRPYGKRSSEGEEAWRAVGRNVKYCRRERGRGSEQRVEFSLSFQVQLQKEEEFCIASSVPYTFSFLKQRLALLSSPLITQQVLCKTLTGLEVPLITVNPHATSKPHHRYIIINARTHPGESPSSWVADGLLAHLAASSPLHELLAEFAVVLKVVPMLNVEGVCLGNYRTGSMGMDFNRLFLSGSPDLFPEVAALKRLVEDCKARGKVDLFLDLHGHSILPGCFMYGPDPAFAPTTALRRLVGEMGKSGYFMKGHCIQGVDSSKAETSRIYFQAHEGVFSLTCQNSLGLYCRNGQKGREAQFEARDWQEFGKELVTIMLNIYDEYGGEEREESSPKLNAFEEALSLLRSTEEEQFVWEKSKTDTGQMSHQLRLLDQLQLDQIDLPPQLTISQDLAPQECPSLNDSDASSEDLSLYKQQQLIKIVRKNIVKQAPGDAGEGQSGMKERGARSGSKGIFINNFKEYRFGVEDSTVSEWHTRKRLFSVPKHLKHERHGQSYLIRKKLPLPPNSELAAESADIAKRIRTEQRQRPFDRSSNKELGSRQKQLLENLLMRR